MPQGRIKGLAGKPSIYHCMSRTVNGEFLFDAPAKEMLREQLWKAAEFSGVQILTYAIMSNHFHVLVSVPDRGTIEPEVSDDELIRRYRVLYPKPTRFRPAQICVLETKLAAGGEEATNLRRSLLARMHDVSEFVKTVKQRFSVWFNRDRNRYGTLWADRFRSTLVEFSNGEALLTVAAYIDLNPLRARLVEDPKDYRWSGYGEAVSGSDRARIGLRAIQGSSPRELTDVTRGGWEDVAAEYRLLLYCKGATTKGSAATVTDDAFAAVLRARGRLSLPQLLHCRVRAFTDGAVLGSRLFVAEMLARYRERTGRRCHAGPRPLMARGDCLLLTLRGFTAN